MRRLPDDTIEAVLEPLDGLVLVDAVLGADTGLAAAALSDTLTRAGPIIPGQSLKLALSWSNSMDLSI